MEVPQSFLKTRAWIFSLKLIVSFTWIIVLSVEAFTRWSLSGQAEQAFLAALLLVNSITVIMLPILLLVRFRVWLDTARIGFLLASHGSIAIAYSSSFSSLQCVQPANGDEGGVCALVNMYTLLGCWVVPAMLIGYCACLAAIVHRCKKRLAIRDLEAISPSGEENYETTDTMQVWPPEDARNPWRPSTLSKPSPTIYEI